MKLRSREKKFSLSQGEFESYRGSTVPGHFASYIKLMLDPFAFQNKRTWQPRAVP